MAAGRRGARSSRVSRWPVPLRPRARWRPERPWRDARASAGRFSFASRPATPRTAGPARSTIASGCTRVTCSRTMTAPTLDVIARSCASGSPLAASRRSSARRALLPEESSTCARCRRGGLRKGKAHRGSNLPDAMQRAGKEPRARWGYLGTFPRSPPQALPGRWLDSQSIIRSASRQ